MKQPDLDSAESIGDLASYLKEVENPEDLRELQTVPEFTPARLQKASKLLPPEQFQLVKKCAQINLKLKQNSKN